MWKFLKWVSYIILALIILWFLALFLLIMFVNPNDYKPQIEKAFSEATGRTLALVGPIHWKIFPTVGLSLENVKIKNPNTLEEASGSTTHYPDFMVLNSANVSVQLWPLVHKKIEIDTISLTGVNLNLIENSPGKNNWTFNFQKNAENFDLKNSMSISKTSQIALKDQKKLADQNLSHIKQPMAGFQMPVEVKIQNVYIKDVNIHFQGSQPNQIWVLKNLNFTAHNLALGAIFPTHFGLTFIHPGSLPIVLSGSTNVKINLATPKQPLLVNLTNMSLHMNQSNLTGEFKFENATHIGGVSHIFGHWMLDQIDLANYLDLHGARLILGETMLHIDLNTQGFTPELFPSTLQGHIHAEIAQGILKGIDIGGMLTGLNQTVNDLVDSGNFAKALSMLAPSLPSFSATGKSPVINPDNGQKTLFQNFTYDGIVEKGVLNNPSVVLKGNQFELNASGEVNLNRQTLYYQADAFATPKDPDPNKNLILNFIISGPFADIHAGVDMEKLMPQIKTRMGLAVQNGLKNTVIPNEKGGLANTVQSTVKGSAENLKNLGNKVKQHLNGWFFDQ